MGLVPSRTSLHEAATSTEQPLPYISRPVESYVYKTNRTERTLGSGVPGFITGLTPLPAALPETTMAVLHGAPALELAHKLSNELADAVFVDDPAEASAAVAAIMAANRPGRRGGGGGGGAPKGGKGQGESAVQAAAEEGNTAAQALRDGKAPFVYYYEHRVLPLTTEYFPSPDCLLFQQLWHARQHQNPRYHFQMDETWSPGALMDPTAHYESFSQLAAHSMTDLQAACLTASGGTPTRGGVLQAEAELAAAKAELKAAETDSHAIGMHSGGKSVQLVHASASSSSEAPRPSHIPVPFATRDEFYKLMVRTTEDAMLYESDDALRAAVQHAEEDRTGTQGDRDDSTSPSAAATPRRLRPVPCAIVLVRRCMSAQQYRYTYYVANHERHHRTGEKENPRRDLQTIAVTGGAVRVAVEEARRVQQARTAARECPETEEEPLMVPWLQVSVPQIPLDLAEVRVVGMYGCWTMEEVLRHSLFVPTSRSTGGLDAEVQARVDAVLRRACPHGVPSSTLLNVGFFEKQVGDKEQCHTYFSLCRLFAHGMRACILRDVISAGAASTLACTLGGDDFGDESIDAEVDRERMEGELRELRRQQQHPLWQRFLRVVAGDSADNTRGFSSRSGRLFADFSHCFLIRFSNVPQLQLCRQLRLLLTGMAGVYPQPIALELFQAAQRQRNMLAMARKQPLPASAVVFNTTIEAAAAVVPMGGGEGRGGSTVGATMALPTLSNTDHTNTTMEGSGLKDATAGSSPLRTRLSLDPSAIGERRQDPHHACELTKLTRDGFCCYASNGLVVFRVTRACVAHALSQLGFAPLKDSIEALCVTLTAAAPPPLTYRGELRPPLQVSHIVGGGAGQRHGAAASQNEHEEGDYVNVGEEELCEVDSTDTSGPIPTVAASALRRDDAVSAVAAASTAGGGGGGMSEELTLDAVRGLYCNALRYACDATAGFPALRFSSHSSAAGAETSALLKLDPLEATSDDKIGLLPRNPVEQRRGRLLPLRRALLQETRTNTPNLGAEGGGSSEHTAAKVSPANDQQHFDVYTVSEELDGVTFRRLVELTHHVEHTRHTHSGGADTTWPDVLVEAVDAQGNAEPDSVLNWSPMAALSGGGGGRTRPTSAQGGEAAATAAAGGVHDESTNGGESTTPAHLSETLHSTASLQSSQSAGKVFPGVVPIRVHDPDRVLHTGDRIRFAPPQGGASPNTSASRFADANSPSSTSAELLSPQQPTSANVSPRQRSNRRSNSSAMRHGYWYVDDTLTTEDLVLSWMRRVGGRARETRGHDTKWVRYPSPVLTALLQFARLCKQKPSGGWLSTTVPLRLLHPMDDELVEPDMLVNFPDIVRTRRFRQWRFSHDGYVYFHGVTVRMPGTALPLQVATAMAQPSTPQPALARPVEAGTAVAGGEGRAPVRGAVKTAPRTGQAREGQGDAMGLDLGRRTPSAMQYQQQQQQQQLRHSVFVGVPRPPTVMQRGACEAPPPGQREAGAAFYSSHSATSPGPHLGFYQPRGTPPQQLGGYDGAPFHQPSSSVTPPNAPQMQEGQQSYQQQMPTQRQQQQHQQPFVHAGSGGNPMNAGPLLQQQQRHQHQHQRPGANAAVFSPFPSPAEAYYGQQAPVNVASAPPAAPAPPTTMTNSPNPYTSMIFSAGGAMGTQVRATSGGNPSATFHKDGDSGVVGSVASLRSPGGGGGGGGGVGGGSQMMHFSLQHMDSASSFRSYDRTASYAMMGPTHVTGSFYGDFYGHNAQRQQQQQQLTSPETASVHSGADYHGGGSEPWQQQAGVSVGGSHASHGMQTPDGSALTSTPLQRHEGQCYPHHPGAAAAAAASGGDGGGRSSPTPQQQQQRYESTSSMISRRSTSDYPPRRSGGPFLTGGGGGTAMAQPSVQRAVSRPIQTAHVDPTRREVAMIAGESGAPLRLPIPKSRMQPVHNVASVQTPLTPIEQQQQLQLQQQYRQQQHPQQQQIPLVTSPHLSSALGSFREPADVIETEGLTVHVMQRKPSMSVRRTVVSPHSLGLPPSSYGSGRVGGGAAAAGGQGYGYTPSAGDTAAEERADYGAIGVSPNSGLDATTGPGQAAADEANRGVLAQLSYEMPAAMSPTNMANSRATSFALSGGAGMAGASRSLSRSAGTGGANAATADVATPLQRPRSQRVSHNPYAARDVSILHGCTPSSTPVLTHASFSSYSHGGGGGTLNTFQAALDTQYGSDHDFIGGVGAAGGASARSAFAQRPSAMAHGMLYGRSGVSLTTEAAQAKHNSFYAAPEEDDQAVPTPSYSTHEMYQDTIADGTTQGFYYSMEGPDDNNGGGSSAAQQLYGRGDGGAGYAGGRRQETVHNHTGNTPYANIPAPPSLQRTQHSSYRNLASR